MRARVTLMHRPPETREACIRSQHPVRLECTAYCRRCLASRVCSGAPLCRRPSAVYGQVGAPPLAKRVDAELGCVTPYIVVPGAWTEADMEYYADEIVAGLVNNAGHNCTKAELLVTAAEWPLRGAFVDAVRCVPCISVLPGSCTACWRCKRRALLWALCLLSSRCCVRVSISLDVCDRGSVLLDRDKAGSQRMRRQGSAGRR